MGIQSTLTSKEMCCHLSNVHYKIIPSAMDGCEDSSVEAKVTAAEL